MLLKEFIYFDKDSTEPKNDSRYLDNNDSNILKDKDLRKSRFTLKMLRELRYASEAHETEVRQEQVFLRQMYAMPAQPQTP
jgi:hypothetical protein